MIVDEEQSVCQTHNEHKHEAAENFEVVVQ